MLRLIHTADWQIGKTFGGLPPQKQAILREARLHAIDRIAEAARRHGAEHILVAGDVFDSEALPAGVVRRLLERLKAHAPLSWHLLPGNHDPDRSGGIYERLCAGGLPTNVIVHRQPAIVALAPGVALLPAPLKSRAATEDPTAWMDHAATPADTLRIGLAHGSVQGFGHGSESAARLSADRRRRAGLAYLALGDWHGTKEVAAGVWYAGTPEPDRFLDNASGQVLAVEVGGRQALQVTPVATAAYRWLGQQLAVRSEADIEELERGLGTWVDGLDRLLVRLELSGRLALAAHGQVLTQVAGLGERLFHLEVERDDLHVQPAGDEVAGLGEGSDLARVAGRLLALRDQERSPHAERALEILFRLAAGAGR